MYGTIIIKLLMYVNLKIKLDFTRTKKMDRNSFKGPVRQKLISVT
jgi:hypothetical protein